MRSFVCLTLGMILSTGLLSCSGTADETERRISTIVTDETRRELFEARENAWRSFFQKDPSAVERILAPELIAIQQSAERWDTRAELIELAKLMSEREVQLTRLEFPHTEVQVFGDTAILYYTYFMEQRMGKSASLEAGRGTEIFVRSDNRWVDVGWHLDSGAFRRRNGAWLRVGKPLPEPSP